MPNPEQIKVVAMPGKSTIAKKLLSAAAIWWLVCVAFSFSVPLLEKSGCNSEMFCRYTDGWDNFLTSTKFTAITLIQVWLVVLLLAWLRNKFSIKILPMIFISVVACVVLLSLIPFEWRQLVTGIHYWIS